MTENFTWPINRKSLTENDLFRLVHALGLQVAKSVMIKCQSDLGNGRKLFEIGFFGGEQNAEYGSMVIDYGVGNSHLDQVYNLVYGPSADCRFKVILFTREKQADELNDPSARLSVVTDLITYLNIHGARLYLVEATIGSAQVPTFNVLIEPDFSTPKNLPHERIVRANEFWGLYFYYYDKTFEVGPWFALREGDGSDIFKAYVDNDDIVVAASWNENGLFYKIYDHSEKEYLLEAYQHKRRKLQALFPDYEKNCKESISEVGFQVTDKPFDWVLNATSAQKKEIGFKIWTEMSELLRFSVDAVEDVKLNKYAKNPGVLQI